MGIGIGSRPQRAPGENRTRPWSPAGSVRREDSEGESSAPQAWSQTGMKPPLARIAVAFSTDPTSAMLIPGRVRLTHSATMRIP